MRPLSDVFFAVATGPARRRRVLTPIGLIFFFGLLSIVVIGGVCTDRMLALPPVLPGRAGTVSGLAALAAGVALWVWCASLFWNARGTPVPLSPPRELVEVGPYAWMRNPMMTGVFAGLCGVGLVLHSLSMLVLWVPAFVLLDVLELKRVEEPELERRLGEKYVAYKSRVPMFLPRLAGRGHVRHDS